MLLLRKGRAALGLRDADVTVVPFPTARMICLVRLVG